MSSDLAVSSPSTSSDSSDCSFSVASDIEEALPPDKVFVEDVDAHVDHFWKKTRAAVTRDRSLKYRVAKVNRYWKELAEGLASLFNERGQEWDSTSFMVSRLGFVLSGKCESADWSSFTLSQSKKFCREQGFNRRKGCKLLTLFKKSKWRNCHTTSLDKAHVGVKRHLEVALLLKDLEQDLCNEVAAIAGSETTEQERRAILASEKAETVVSCQSSDARHAATSTRSSSMKPEPKESIVAGRKHPEHISSMYTDRHRSWHNSQATTQSNAECTSVLSGSEQRCWSLKTKPQAEIDPSVTSSVLSDVSDYTFDALRVVMGEQRVLPSD